ncbi:hypothetical protein [Streptomyces yatensis]|uniref:Membrane transporter protein n=1 Tax=Streptomyces yatensis TaxID=155177 RepID=A0ABN2IW82_9ACTN|nr:hypothetical protein [Streptomyces yatensis]
MPPALGAATGAVQALITWRRGPTARIAGPLLASLAFAAGTAVGPVVSGLLAQYAPGTLTTPHVLHLALALRAWVWQRLRRTVPAPTAVRGAGAQRRWRPTRPHSGAMRAVDARTPAGQRAGIEAALYLPLYWGWGAHGRRRAADRLDATHRGGDPAQLGRSGSAGQIRFGWAGSALAALVLSAGHCRTFSARRHTRAGIPSVASVFSAHVTAPTTYVQDRRSAAPAPSPHE